MFCKGLGRIERDEISFGPYTMCPLKGLLFKPNFFSTLDYSVGY